jgi:formate hydrogenlyase subunit 3/multisubunit Na+/H+ antiporter MnhD subunit
MMAPVAAPPPTPIAAPFLVLSILCQVLQLNNIVVHSKIATIGLILLILCILIKYLINDNN